MQSFLAFLSETAQCKLYIIVIRSATSNVLIMLNKGVNPLAFQQKQKECVAMAVTAAAHCHCEL